MKYLLLAVIFIGCSSPGIIRDHNRQNILKLQIGMTRSTVLSIMGNESEDMGRPIGVVSNPYSSEIMRDSSGNIYEILYYYTDIQKSDYAITQDELTPLVFYKNELQGWGWRFLNDTIEKYEIRIR